MASKQQAVDALDKLELEEEVLRDTASGYVVAAEAAEDVKAQRRAVIDRLCESIRRAHTAYMRDITVVRCANDMYSQLALTE